MMPRLNMRITSFRIDGRAVSREVHRAARSVYSRQGAYVRGIAQRSIRRRKNRNISSPAGMPPYTHTGALKRSIRFAASETNVVIGPAASVIGGIAATHEFGGTEAAVMGRSRNARWSLKIGGHGPLAVRDGRVMVGRLRTERQVRRARDVAATLPAGMTATKSSRRYPARPFMGPALAVARARLPEFWRNSVRRTA